MQLKDNSLRSYNYGAGVIVGRFQVHTLHQEQKKIIEYVGMNHNRVIVFIGVSRTPPSFNSDFRAGVINSVYNRYSITYTTVDICAYNNEGQILLARKPSEDKFRFVGGFVDTDDESLEVAVKIEFEDETGEDEMVLYFDGSNKEKPFGEGMDDYFIDVRNRIRTQWDSMPLDLTDGDNRYPATGKVLQKRIELLKKYAPKKNVKNYK